MPAKKVIRPNPESSVLKSVSHPTTSTRQVSLPLLPPTPQLKYFAPLVPVSLEKGQKESVLASSATLESAVLLPQQSELRVILTLSLLMAFFQAQGVILHFQAMMFLSLWTWTLNSVLTPRTSLQIPSWNGIISKKTQFNHRIGPLNQPILLPSYSQVHPKKPSNFLPVFHFLLILYQT